MVDAISTSLLSGAAPKLQPQAVSAAAGESPQAAGPEFVSSSIRVDNLQNVAILEYRSSQTGEVVRQYPTQGQIDAFKRAEHLQGRSSAPTQTADVAVGDGPRIIKAAPKSAPAAASAPAPSPHSGGGGTGGTHSVVA
jgi:hypothetical protein